MSLQMRTMQDIAGLVYASISWSATTVSTQLVAAPSTGKLVSLRWLYVYQSAFGSVQLFSGTAAASSAPIWYWPGANGNPVAEEAFINGSDGQGIVMNTGNSYGGGNGVLRAYYCIIPNSGGGATSANQGF